MTYLKNFLICFLIVFFVNYLFPGIDVVNQTKLPHIGGDLIFAAILGLLNSLIFPLLRVMDKHTNLIRIVVVTAILNFAVYALLKLLPFGVFVTNVEGYFFGAIFVTLGSFLVSYFQYRYYRNLARAPRPHEHHHD